MNEEDDKAKEKERKQDEQDVTSFKSDSKKSSKKIKNPFTMLLRRIGALIAAIPIIIKVIIAIVIASLISLGLAWIHDQFSSNVMADVASERILKEAVEVDRDPSFEGVPIGGTDDDGWRVKVKDLGYYLKLSKEAQEKYIEELSKAYIQGYYSMKKKDEDEVKSREEANLLYDPADPEFNFKNVGKWFESENFKDYFVRMIRAEIESSIPKLSDYKGNGGMNPTDRNGDYVSQGIGKLGRITIDDNGKPNDETCRMYHMQLEDFIKLINECNATGKEDALYYFSYIPEEQAIYYAVKTRVITKENQQVVSDVTRFELAGPFSYQSVVDICAMPYNFLFTILSTSENPEWIMSVIDLLEQSKVHVIIQDGLSITRVTEITDKGTKTVTITEDLQTGEKTESEPTYAYPAPGTEKEIEETTYRHTATVYIKFAETWCMDVNAEASLIEEPGRVTSDQQFSPSFTDAELEQMCTTLVKTEDVSSDDSNTKVTMEVYESPEQLRRHKEEIVKIYRWAIHSLREINYTRFLGTWRNATGEVGGGLYTPSGIEVKYLIPGMTVRTAIPPDNLSDDTHQNINLVIELLRLHENTQMHEMLMQYYWNIYNDRYIYDITAQDILDKFNTDILGLDSSTLLSGTLIENYIKAWGNSDIWNYERKETSVVPMDYMTSDGENYIVYNSGGSKIAFDIDINMWADIFKDHGIDVNNLSVGSIVPKNTVDAVFTDILKSCEDSVDNYLNTHGLKLNDSQRDALVSIYYSNGTIQGFSEAYQNSVDSNGNLNADKIKDNFVLPNNKKPFSSGSGGGNKSSSDWNLFNKEEYKDTNSNDIKAVGGSILQCAKQIHDYMSDPDHLYFYCLADPGGKNEEKEKWKHDAEGLKCGLNRSFAKSQIPGSYGYRLTCCATYVSWVLEAAGYLDTHTNSTSGLDKLLQERGWKVINTSTWKDLQPGDVTIANGHTQLYVGDGCWYNAGAVSSIQRREPYYSKYTGFKHALRAPY